MQTPSVMVYTGFPSPHTSSHLPKTQQAVGTYGNVPECLPATRRPHVSPGGTTDHFHYLNTVFFAFKTCPLGSDPRQVLLSSGGGHGSASSSPGTGNGVPSASSPSLLAVLRGSRLSSSDWAFTQQVCTQHAACAGDQQGTSLSRLLTLPGR